MEQEQQRLEKAKVTAKANKIKAHREQIQKKIAEL
jgi:hypothetical protein